MELGIDFEQIGSQNVSSRLTLVITDVIDILDIESGIPHRLAIRRRNGGSLEGICTFGQIEAVMCLITVITQLTLDDRAVGLRSFTNGVYLAAPLARGPSVSSTALFPFTSPLIMACSPGAEEMVILELAVPDDEKFIVARSI